MKHLFSFLLLLAFVTKSNAQVDVQINPVAILFSSLNLTAEFPVSPDFGIEGGLEYNFQHFDVDDIEYKNNGVGIRAIGKYYFSPDKGIDKWNIGGYLKYAAGNATGEDNATGDRETVKSTRFGIGFYTGHKWVSRKNIVFELGLGIGRNFVSKYEYEDGTEANTDDIPLLEIDIILRLSLGYRFGGSSVGAKK
jgi:hypothetical protein